MTIRDPLNLAYQGAKQPTESHHPKTPGPGTAFDPIVRLDVVESLISDRVAALRLAGFNTEADQVRMIGILIREHVTGEKNLG